ncbi:molybdenum cofactor biosynthesis protein [Serinibacter arcticus]|uniref:Molybdenum cofactor biosynthesis protein n=1 Tax=Serinibacter arcticus TaxID=1655435 RepID=A0A2U1ZZY1_9MICO|nr:molybdenum cofactor biosynthesis protein [Serinibacter arcticus]
MTVSDRSASGERADASGPAAREALVAAGFADVVVTVVPDGEAPVREALTAALADGARLVLTLGGTGVGPRDRTPEGTRGVIELELPGIAEVLRERGRAAVATAALTRGIAGTVGDALVVNLPGSPKAVLESFEVLLPLVGHVLDQLAGGDH